VINRIRDIRLQQGLTLADVAARCQPPTTAQTIGRLETGMRTLSLAWLNRIAAALAVDPEQLLRSDSAQPARIVASLGPGGAEALRAPREAVLPTDLSAELPWLVLCVETSCGEYRTGDLVWMRQHAPEDAAAHLHRDVLAPRPGGHFGFGRMIAASGNTLTLLPPVAGQPAITVEEPSWMAVAEMLVRKL